jgi:hypothetical protein
MGGDEARVACELGGKGTARGLGWHDVIAPQRTASGGGEKGVRQ